MINSIKLQNKINDYYLSIQSERISKEVYIEEILMSNEEYVNVVNELGKTNLLIAKAEYSNDLNSIKLLQNNVDILNEKKLKLLDKLINYKDFSKNNYQCEYCKDTGEYNGTKCKCYYKLLTTYALESLNVNKRDFNNFPTVVNDSLKKHYTALKVYADKFPSKENKNLVFTGKVGTGKTYLASCIANEIVKKDLIAIFLSATELNNIFLKMHFSEIDRELAFNILSNCDLLVIDDLGTEPIYKNVTIEYLTSLISDKIDRQKKFIITTNLTATEIQNRYNERILSRLCDKTKTMFIPFNGEDLRKQ